MDHVVYLDAKSNEINKLKDQSKTMIIRGATGRKLPYNRVFEGDILYFVENNGDGTVRLKAIVKHVINSEKMTIEMSEELVKSNQLKLQLTKQQFKRWAGKRYIVLIEVTAVESIEPFIIDRSNYGNMDDWLPVEDIKKVFVKLI